MINVGGQCYGCNLNLSKMKPGFKQKSKRQRLFAHSWPSEKCLEYRVREQDKENPRPDLWSAMNRPFLSKSPKISRSPYLTPWVFKSCTILSQGWHAETPISYSAPWCTFFKNLSSEFIQPHGNLTSKAQMIKPPHSFSLM